MKLQRNLIKYPNSLKISKSIFRNCVSESNDTPDEKIVTDINKRKPKLIAVSRYFPKGSSSPIILEAKNAASVIKNLNYQFKILYGDLISSKSTNNLNKINGSKNIIQNETVFPIVEPKGDFNYFNSTNSNENNECTESSFSKVLLKFPLLNKQSAVLNSKLEISEINSLRKILEEKSKSYVPSISRILEKTMPHEQAERLRRWKENMIKEMGEEEFKKYQEELLSRGQTFHACINNYLASVPRTEIEIEKAVAGHWESLKQIFPFISDVKLLEERITHPFLRYKGIVDCFARYKDNLVVIDWKTSKKKKLSLSSTFDNPLQIVAYVGALNFDPKYQYLASKGLIVVAYEDGSPASAHFMDENVLHHYWKKWLARLKLYWEIVEKEENNPS